MKGGVELGAKDICIQVHVHLATSFTPANAYATQLGLLLSKTVMSLLLTAPPAKRSCLLKRKKKIITK